VSDETKKKVSEGLKRYFANKKLGLWLVVKQQIW
jgi:hypothetical protein